MKLFIRSIFAVAALLMLAACDKDFNEMGADIVGDDHFDFALYDGASIVANNVATGVVQTNNLDINPLGIYANPAFGTTTANLVTQIEMATVNPTFTTINEAPVVEEVYLEIPYFSTFLETNSDGEKLYELDSIYGAEGGKMKLGIYESGYFLRDMDHDPDGTQILQRYYSDQNGDIDAAKNPNRLNNDENVAQNDEFFFDKKEISITEEDDDGEETTTEKVPGMRIKLDNAFFQSKIIEAPAGMLQNNNVFKNYFRGLYFKIESIGQGGQLAMLNFKNGTITMKYKEDLASTTGGTVTRPTKTMQFKLAGNTISLLQHSPLPAYQTNIAQPFSPTVGHDKLFLLGGQGAVATIDLFGADDPDDEDTMAEELEVIKEEGWLINEASLNFYIENNAMTGAAEPRRIYLYDVNNKRPIIDYYYDTSTSSNGKFSKFVHSGIIVTDSDKRGTNYKIRLTNHIRDLIKNDSTNVRLGLAVTESITNIAMVKQKLPNANSEHLNSFVPASSAMNPLGTILYGTGPNVPADKRLKLHIYYTKPN